ncbi:MAG: N-methyl-L-tryptophan oxidase [Actinomycetota bacterium]|nr:N-methyl-L-tryptophan oxidase [Actinomycetota bacterium]
METFDVVVIGAGVMGAATGRALAKAGKKVAMLERFEIGHNRGSSHGSARIFRFSYRDPQYVAMAQEALPLWRDLEEEAGERLLAPTGGIDTGPLVPQHAAALESCAATYELLDGATVNARFPGLTLPADAEALYQPEAAVIAAERAWRALTASAVKAGADLREHSTVTEVVRRPDGVEVAAAGVRLQAKIAVVTAGAWARELLGTIDIELGVVPTRETVAYFHTSIPDVPVLVAWSDPAFYALPTPLGIKAGHHIAGPPADPDEEGSPDADSVARLSEGVAGMFARVDPTPRLAETCFYTNTPDEHFVLERHGPVLVGSPCSGHGFKFAPLIGRRLADLCGV